MGSPGHYSTMARRSLLFSPGDRPEMLRKAPRTGADVVIFDLEDAVAPARKDQAREAVAAVLSDGGFAPDCEVCIRVNPGTVDADDDLAAIDGFDRMDSIMLPKVDSAADVETLDRLFDEHDLDLPVIALVETAAGILAAADIARTDRVDALAFGAEDLSADIGATRTSGGEEVLFARQKVVIAAAAAGIEALDTVYTDIDDLEGLREETRYAIQLGYDGKPAIHPAQVDVINDAFTPDADQIQWARRVLRARESADATERGVFRIDGEMIDAPLVTRAERIADRARAAGEW